jgi:hypothetical protein
VNSRIGQVQVHEIDSATETGGSLGGFSHVLMSASTKQMRLLKIVSGGQTGVDRAALDAAQAFDLSVGGWCPKGRRAEDGRIPARYPLSETPSADYEQRTAWNVRDSDGTLIITDGVLEGGTARTMAEAQRRGRPVLHVRTTDPVPIPMIRAWGEDHGLRTMNVAGPRASEADGIYDRARGLLSELFTAVFEIPDG